MARFTPAEYDAQDDVTRRPAYKNGAAAGRLAVRAGLVRNVTFGFDTRGTPDGPLFRRGWWETAAVELDALGTAA